VQSPEFKPYSHPKKRKRKRTKLKIDRRKEIIKIRVEINKIETQSTIERINETKLIL
jgi:hypothetical protein